MYAALLISDQEARLVSILINIGIFLFWQWWKATILLSLITPWRLIRQELINCATQRIKINIFVSPI
ncbi:hypothetical protein BpHYR1_052248 [Brachionus plicatilis]|uniref:Uncharacterized protein n=1 Tax=Brachionus plicatilis TaxID=10195 RepID=A0A3M7TAD9_BRAPC|nr:hypothetical protein BpHYR1_052248 [Brachionus plicatilis]